jgi:hypothetical protein
MWILLRIPCCEWLADLKPVKSFFQQALFKRCEPYITGSSLLPFRCGRRKQESTWTPF